MYLTREAVSHFRRFGSTHLAIDEGRVETVKSMLGPCMNRRVPVDPGQLSKILSSAGLRKTKAVIPDPARAEVPILVSARCSGQDISNMSQRLVDTPQEKRRLLKFGQKRESR